jgi:hypothetical protein
MVSHPTLCVIDPRASNLSNGRADSFNVRRVNVQLTLNVYLDLTDGVEHRSARVDLFGWSRR